MDHGMFVGKKVRGVAWKVGYFKGRCFPFSKYVLRPTWFTNLIICYSRYNVRNRWH